MCRPEGRVTGCQQGCTAPSPTPKTSPASASALSCWDEETANEASSADFPPILSRQLIHARAWRWYVCKGSFRPVRICSVQDFTLPASVLLPVTVQLGSEASLQVGRACGYNMCKNARNGDGLEHAHSTYNAHWIVNQAAVSSAGSG